MTPGLFIDCGIMPAYGLLPAKMASREATAMLIAIGLIESRFQFRRQVVRYSHEQPVYGPARGYLQFESGGIFGVLRHEASRVLVREVLAELNYDDDMMTAWMAVEHNDVLAATFGRLLLWTDPKPIPQFGQDVTAYEYYLRLWRPGKPQSQETFTKYFDEAWRIAS